MGYEDLDPKYLDPAVYPFLPGSDAKPFEKKPDPPDRYVDPAHNPMIDARAETGSIVEAEILADKINGAFPTENMIVLGGVTIIRMADGAFTVNGKPLAELPAATLEAISAALKEKK